MAENTKNSVSRDSDNYEFLLTRSLLMVKEYDRSWNWVFVVTLILALLSTLMNVGAIVSNEINLGFAKLIVSNARPIKVSLCFASVSGAVVLTYLHSFSWRAVYIGSFLEEKGFGKAAILSEYSKWEIRHRPFFNLVQTVCALLILLLQAAIFVVIPIWTLISYGLAS